MELQNYISENSDYDKTLKEKEDTTEVQDTVACGGGACEIPGLPEMVPVPQHEVETA